MKLILFNYMNKKRTLVCVVIAFMLFLTSLAFIPSDTFDKERFNKKLAEVLSANKISAGLPDWALLDPDKDGYEGTRTLAFREYVNSLQTLNAPQQVIVAVIDGGIQLDHPGLKNNIWQNMAEINGVDGVDDDGNGYIDDYNGWNFLAEQESLGLEVTREYFKMKNRGISEKDPYFKKVKEDYTEEKTEVLFMRMGINNTADEMRNAIQILKERNYPTEPEQLEKISNTLTGKYAEAAAQILNAYFLFGESPEGIFDLQKQYEVQFKFLTDTTATYVYVGDNPELFWEKGYGNNKPNTGSMDHGTHSAGIIASNINTIGQSPYAKIMALRCVPDEGDERDKDIANAIRYAVDNGASIINMSAGKYYSPDADKVVEALRYAEEKGVLFVSSAGNEGSDIEQLINYPRKFVKEDGQIKYFSNMLVVGASSWMQKWSKAKDPDDMNGRFDLAAAFSNYSGNVVDIFAPGVQINSTNANSTYKKLDGTSFSAPEVTGIAANLKAFFPALTASQIKEIISSSARTYPGLEVKVRGRNGTVLFGELSRSGGVVDMLNAYKRAIEVAHN